MVRQTVIGKIGEEIALAYLLKQNYAVLAKRYRIRGGEVDIIALNKKTLICIEVKTRTQEKFGSGADALNRSKMQALVRTMKDFIMVYGKKIIFTSLRYDLIDLRLDFKQKRVLRLIHYKNVQISHTAY